VVSLVTKPTGGLVPGSGQYPIAEGKALRYLTTGPICRHAIDLFPLLKILSGPDGIDEGCQSFSLLDPNTVNFSDLSVFNIEGNGIQSVSKPLIEAQRKCASFLEEKGATVKTIKLDKLKKSLEIWSGLLNDVGGTSFATLLRNGSKKNFWKELLIFLFFKSDHTFPAIALAVIEQITKIIPSDGVKIGAELKRELIELLGDNGVILYPSYPTVAPLHHKPIFPPFNWVYTAIWNSMEVPVTQVPLGLDSNGLPLGVQIVGAHGRDHVTIAVALELEKKFGGWSHRN